VVRASIKAVSSYRIFQMEQASGGQHFPWRTLILSAGGVAICAIGAAVALAGIRGCQRGPETVITAAEKFMTGTITETFVSRVTEIRPTKGDILEVATMKTDEIFRKEDARTIGWGVDLGSNVVEIRAPVTFRYHIRLTDTWRLATRGNICLVQAPAIRASQPPAIHTDQMEKRTEVGWGRFSAQEMLKEVERNMTPVLRSRAEDEKHVRLVRESCRQAVAEFVRTWLLQEEQWKDDRLNSIIVVFPDEWDIETDEQLEAFVGDPTVELKVVGER